MSRALVRLGGLLLVASVVYLAAAQIVFGSTDRDLFRKFAGAGVVCLALGFLLAVASRAWATIIGRSCPRCGRRVARGRVYCDEHLQDTINEYRDAQRRRS